MDSSILPQDPSSPEPMTAQYESLSYHQVQASHAEVENDASVGPWCWLEWIFWSPASVGPISQAATAQAMDSVAKGVMHASAAFFGPALLQFALDQVEQQQQQDDNDCPYEQCSLLWGFWRPSAVLTTSSVISVLSATIGIPLLGAYIDRQRYDPTQDHGRYTAGKVTAYCLALIHLAQMFVHSSTWFFFWISHTVAEALNMVHQMIILAYLQDVTTDVPTLTRYTSHFAFLQFIAMLVFLVTVAVYARSLGRDNENDDKDDAMVRTSRFANGVAGTVGLVVMGYAWAYLFSRHKEDHVIPGSLTGVARTCCEDLYLSGKSLARLARLIRRDYPALQWLVVTLLFSPSVGSGSYFSIFSTLHKVLVEMNGAQIGLANLVALAFAMMGSRLAAWVSHHLNALVSFQLSLATLMITFTCTAWFVRGPQDLHLYYCLLAALGLVLGWLMPTERVLFCTLAPSENQAEMMGLLVSVHTALAFIPPLLFSIVTQLGYSLQWGVLSQNVLLFLALWSTCMIGPYDRAVAQARRGPTFDPNG